MARCELVRGYVQDVPADTDYDAVVSLFVAHFVQREDRPEFYRHIQERLIRASGLAMPVQFFQAFMIGGWYARNGETWERAARLENIRQWCQHMVCADSQERHVMTKYTGGCHCGKIAYEVEGAFDTAMVCNCSHCSMKGFRLAFVPRDAFTLKKGEGAWTTYTFNKGAIDHNFCKTCGVESFAFGRMPDGSDVAAINLNCVDALGAADLPVTSVDGASY